MQPLRFIRELLRVPLVWKIVGANALMVVVLAGVFYAIPAWLSGPSVSSAVLIAGILAAGGLNVVFVNLALQPIRELESAARSLWNGSLDIRARPSRLADREVSRIATTINTLLEQLAAERERLQYLTGQLVAARSSERAALAYELTESVAQSVAALSLECTALKSSSDDLRDIERLERMGRLTRSLMEEIRRIARDVHPRHVDDLGLDAALRSLVRESVNRGSQDVAYTSRGEVATASALPQGVAGSLYDVAREALQNARKYSGARRIDVSLGIQPHVVRLSVADDGCGFDPATIQRTRGLGLNLLRERMALIGGTLEILSHPGKGAHIEAVVPLVREPASAHRMSA